MQPPSSSNDSDAGVPDPLFAGPRPETPHDPYLALRSRDYRRFAFGFAPSSIGLQMLSMAVGWEIYDRTGSFMALAYAGLARAVPVLLLALPAGHLADLYNRRNILVVTQTCFALAAGALAAASYLHAPVWVYYVLLVVSGAARCFNGPARSSLLPMIVPGPAFQNAVTWNTGVFQVAAIVGPLLAGLMIDASRWRGGEPAAWPVYLVTAAGCAAFAFTASGMRVPASAGPRVNGSVFSFSSMVAGMSHVYKDKAILAALTLDMFAVLLGGATALLPVYTKDILHAGAVWLGILKASQFVGALVMSVWLAHRPPFRQAGATLLWSVAAFGVCMIVFGFSTNVWLSLAALFVSGAVDTISVVIRHVLVQTRTPDHVRGRVSAVNSVFIESSNQLGEFESGAVAAAAGKWLGPVGGAVFSVVSGGVGTILVVVGIALAWPEIRKLKRL